MTASYIQYSDRLRISFDVNLFTYSIYQDSYCLTIPETYQIDSMYFQANYYETNVNNFLYDLEIYFLPTDEFIGTSNVFGDGFISIGNFGDIYGFSSQSPVESIKTSFSPTLGFDQVCFANTCGGTGTQCSFSNNNSNRFVGYIDLFGITTSFPNTTTPSESPTESPTNSPTELPTDVPNELPTDVPTELPTISPTIQEGSTSYIQFDDRLRISFNVNVTYYAYVNAVINCFDFPYTTVYDTSVYESTYFQSSFYESLDDTPLSDFEIYFLPTSEYIGYGYGEYALNQISFWPSSYDEPSTESLDSGILPINISTGFSKVCFANNCQGLEGECPHPFNQFIGYIDLFGLSIYESVYDWSVITSSVETTWRDICTSSSGQYVYAVALFGYIYSSEDYSNTFSLSYESVQQWRAIATTSEGDYVVAAVYDGNVYSYIRGYEWYIVIEISNKWTDVSISGSLTDGFIIYLSAHASYLYQYISNEESTTYADMTKSNWIGITSTRDGLAYAIEKRGYIWRYHVNTWSVSYSLKSRWSTISSNYNGTYIYAAATDDKIYVSIDDGDTWTVSYSKVNLWSSISVNNNGIVYACDTLGRIYKSIDNNTWNKVYTSTNLWTSISNSDNEIAYAVTYNGNVYSYQIINSPTASPTVQTSYRFQ